MTAARRGNDMTTTNSEIRTRVSRRLGADDGAVGASGANCFAQAERRDDGAYDVLWGWRVSEGYGDDYLSYTFQPLKGGPAPWEGRRVTVADLQQAVELYLTVYDAVLRREGHTVDAPTATYIGSVSR